MYRNYIEELNIKSDEILEYLRKSRADDPTLSVEEVLAKHESILDEWVEKNLSSPIPEENKFREVVSGETIEDRPEVQKVLKLIESPKIKAILIVEVQRLSRGDLEDAGRLIKLLRYTQTLIITPTKIYDLSDEYDRDMFERELKRGNEFLEYQKKIMGRGTWLSLSVGNYLGSIPPYGYDKITITEGKRKHPTLAINESQAEIVRMIFDMFVNQDMGRYVICKTLDKMMITPPRGQYWSPAAMRDLLANIHYTGKVKRNWRKTVTTVQDGEIVKSRPKAKEGDYAVYEGKHPAIISDELFQAAQDKLNRNHRTKPNTKIRNPFAGLVYCKCGRAMSLRFYKKPDGTQKSSPRLLCDGQANCNTASCVYSDVLDTVVKVLQGKIAEFEIEIKNNDSSAVENHAKVIKLLEKKLSQLQAKELAQWEAQADPDPANRMPQNIFQALNAKLLKEKEEAEKALEQARIEMPTPIDYERKLVTLHNALDALQNEEMPASEKNRFLKACIERIEYNRAKPQCSPTSGKRWEETPIELDIKLKV